MFSFSVLCQFVKNFRCSPSPFPTPFEAQHSASSIQKLLRGPWFDNEFAMIKSKYYRELCDLVLYSSYLEYTRCYYRVYKKNYPESKIASKLHILQNYG